MKKLKEKINEALSSVAPITVTVFVLSITIAPLPLQTMLMFLAGALLLIIGMGFKRKYHPLQLDLNGEDQ